MAESQADNLSIVRDKELAKLLNVSPVTLWRMREDLPPKIRISKGISGRLRSDVAAWLDARSQRRA